MDYQKTYSELFSSEAYNNDDHRSELFNTVANRVPPETKSLIDVGSGRGRLIHTVCRKIEGIEVTSLDLANFHNIPSATFIKANLSEKSQREEILFLFQDEKFDALTCMDCLEHLDKSFIDDVLFLFSKIAKRSIFTIANHSDVWNGIELHLIQEEPEYWRKIISEHSVITEEMTPHFRCTLFDCSNE